MIEQVDSYHRRQGQDQGWLGPFCFREYFEVIVSLLRYRRVKSRSAIDYFCDVKIFKNRLQ